MCPEGVFLAVLLVVSSMQHREIHYKLWDCSVVTYTFLSSESLCGYYGLLLFATFAVSGAGYWITLLEIR